MLAREGRVVNESSVYGHAKVESDQSEDEKNKLVKFGRMGGTVQNGKNGLIRLFMNRTYDSDIIYRIIGKYRTLQFGDSTDCMMRLVDLGNCNKSKGCVFEMTSDNGGRLETLYQSSLFFKSFVSSYSDFLLIDGTHKTKNYDLSLIVTTIVDSLGNLYLSIF